MLSEHARDMILERDLDEAWVWPTIETPDDVWEGDDGNVHYARAL